MYLKLKLDVQYTYIVWENLFSLQWVKVNGTSLRKITLIWSICLYSQTELLLKEGNFSLDRRWGGWGGGGGGQYFFPLGVVLLLTRSTLSKIFSRQHFEIFFLFLPENRIDISCKIGDNLHEMSILFSGMKCQSCFLRKIRKRSRICQLIN